jgi:hypothetical protein
VYHWASVTAGTWGRSIGFFCGALNFFGWVFGKFPGRCTIGLERGLLTIPQYVFPLPYKFVREVLAEVLLSCHHNLAEIT